MQRQKRGGDYQLELRIRTALADVRAAEAKADVAIKQQQHLEESLLSEKKFESYKTNGQPARGWRGKRKH